MTGADRVPAPDAATALELVPARLLDAEKPPVSAQLDLAPELARRFHAALAGDADSAALALGLATLGLALARHAFASQPQLGAARHAPEGWQGTAVRLRLHQSASLRELFAQVRRQLVQGRVTLADGGLGALAGIDAVFVLDDGLAEMPPPPGRQSVFVLQRRADGLRLQMRSRGLPEIAGYQAAFLATWVRTIDAAMASPDAAWPALQAPVETACLLSPDATGSDEPLAAMFRRAAAAAPEADAVRHGTALLSYRELDRLSDGLAAAMCQAGLQPQQRVVIAGAKGAWSIAAMLATLKAGGTYVSLNARLPVPRLLEILAHSRAQAIVAPTALVEAAGFDALEDAGAAAARTVLLAEDIAYLAGKHAGTGLPPPLGGHALAYVAYTSGSTGRPKGVACTDAAVLALCRWFWRRYPPAQHRQVLQLTELGFDPSVEQIFSTLLQGGCLHLADAGDLQADGAGFLASRRIELVNATPPVLWSLLAEAPRVPSLRTVISGGDRLPPALQAALLERGYALHNHYGPTETTVDACAWQAAPGAAPAVGRAIDGARVAVLDPRSLRECPPGVAGELFIGGQGVAQGYLDQPAATAEAFVPDPERPGARRFRTGDRALRNLAGEIELLGRLNRELKVGGARVDPAEIEQALLGSTGARAAAVVARAGRAGTTVLHAFVATDAEIDPQQLRRRLAALLPEYMLPSRIVGVPALPLDGNGKVDRAALAAAGDADDATVAAPRTAFERDLLVIWHEVFGPEPIGVDDDFIDLGGNSLQAARVVYRIHEAFGVNMGLAEFFLGGSIARCAAWIEDRLLEGASAQDLAALDAGGAPR